MKEEKEENKEKDEEDEEKDSSQNDNNSTVVEKTYMGSSGRKRRRASEGDDTKCDFLFSFTPSQRNMRSHTIDIIYDNPQHRVFHSLLLSSPAALHVLLASSRRQSVHHALLLSLRQILPRSMWLGAFLPFSCDHLAIQAAGAVDLLVLLSQ